MADLVSSERAGPLSGPTGNYDFRVETRGLEPVPEDQRYGDHTRLLTIFFFPNLTPSMFFAGTLATSSFIGLSFTWALVAIVVGNIVACIPVGLLGVFGMRTGLAQLPLARLPFGRSIALPGILNWASTVLWDGLNCLFGAQALHVLLGTPYWGNLFIILALQMLLASIGYEAIHTFGKWSSVVLGAVFVAITIKCITVGTVHVAAQAHGGAAIGGFILMLSIVISYTFTWAPYSSDYTRYLPSSTPASSVVWRMTVGNGLSAMWLEIIGLIAAAKLTDQTSNGIYHFLGAGVFGSVAMIAIVLSNIGADAIDDYSGALSLQAAGILIPRVISSAMVAAAGFGIAMYLNTGNFETKLTNLLLFLGYWIAPFTGILLTDWYMRRGRVDPASLMRLKSLPSGWQAVVAIVAGFGLSVPFMDSSIYVGPVSSGPLKGGDIAYIVGGILASLIYVGLAKMTHFIPAAGHDPGEAVDLTAAEGAAVASLDGGIRA
jgi:NCS1 family nucleobase:cation symporter-1